MVRECSFDLADLLTIRICRTLYSFITLPNKTLAVDRDRSHSYSSTDGKNHHHLGFFPWQLAVRIVVVVGPCYKRM